MTLKAHVCLLLTTAHVTRESTGTASCPAAGSCDTQASRPRLELDNTPLLPNRSRRLRRTEEVHNTPSLSRICMTLRHIQEVHNTPSPLAAQMRQPMVLVARGLTYTHPSLCLPQSATTLWHLPTPESCKRYRANPVLTPDRGVYLFHITSTRLARVGMSVWAQYTSCALLGSSCFFISGDRGVHHPNNSLIDYLDSSRSHALSCSNIRCTVTDSNCITQRTNALLGMRPLAAAMSPRRFTNFTASLPMTRTSRSHTAQTSCSSSRISCSAGSGAYNSATGTSVGCAARARGSRASAGLMSCSSRTNWWIERFL